MIMKATDRVYALFSFPLSDVMERNLTSNEFCSLCVGVYRPTNHNLIAITFPTLSCDGICPRPQHFFANPHSDFFLLFVCLYSLAVKILIPLFFVGTTVDMVFGILQFSLPRLPSWLVGANSQSSS